MSNEMVKRVATAICQASGGDPGRSKSELVLDWKLYEPQARAAIEAMREPSDEMVFRGGLVTDVPWDGKKPARIFAAMIEAALQEDVWHRASTP